MNRGFCAVGLVNPKNSINVGSVLRAAGCFGVSMVICSGKRNKYRRASTDTRASYKHIPLLLVDEMIIPFDCVPVAVDLVQGAKPLIDYKHPERALYVFGAEDATLGKNTLDWCRDKIYIPTQYCLNLACAVNIVLYDRLAKERKSQLTI